MPWWDHLPAGPAAGRSAERELLDAEELDPRDLRVNLREMAMLNRLPGGRAASLRAVRWATRGARRPSVLDVGTGAADFPRRLRSRLPGSRITAVDLRGEVLEVAARTLGHTNGVTLLQADARRLPFTDGAFDVAHASLLLHHLEPDGAVAALREMARVSRGGVVVNDLRRGRVAYLLTAASVLALSRGRYTRHDGVLSARRAYTLPELDALAARAGLRPVRRSPGWWPRVTTVYR